MEFNLDVASFVLGVLSIAVAYGVYKYGIEQGQKTKKVIR